MRWLKHLNGIFSFIRKRCEPVKLGNSVSGLQKLRTQIAAVGVLISTVYTPATSLEEKIRKLYCNVFASIDGTPMCIQRVNSWHCGTIARAFTYCGGRRCGNGTWKQRGRLRWNGTFYNTQPAAGGGCSYRNGNKCSCKAGVVHLWSAAFVVVTGTPTVSNVRRYLLLLHP
jgi:hypothetical protein